jgi:hypothetical protein
LALATGFGQVRRAEVHVVAYLVRVCRAQMPVARLAALHAVIALEAAQCVASKY